MAPPHGVFEITILNTVVNQYKAKHNHDTGLKIHFVNHKISVDCVDLLISFFNFYSGYFPIQNLLKIESSRSSDDICPVISPR